MDPLGAVKADSEGYIDVGGSALLHYELYSPPDRSSSATPGPLLMVMGAFATKAHFADMARYVTDVSGHDVCIFDHRGVGKSSPPKLEAQTATQLARDALEVANTLWGPDAPLHVYGASMGGMVAQELSLLLIPEQRLLSLTLSITCRGMRPFYGLIGPFITPEMLKAFFEVWFWDSRPNLVRRLMRLLLTRRLMDSMHPSGETYGQVYSKVWLQRFDELWTFHNHTAGACHAHVVLHQYTTEAQLATLRNAGVPIACQVSLHDNLIPPAMQLELADKLRARTITIPTGHLGFLPWKERYYGMVLEQLAMGEAVGAINRSKRVQSLTAETLVTSPARRHASLVTRLAKTFMGALSGMSIRRSAQLRMPAISAPTPMRPLRAAASPIPSVELADFDAEPAGNTPDMLVVLDDVIPVVADTSSQLLSAVAPQNFAYLMHTHASCV